MPSVSVLSEYTFNNWGPLTTTWTAPASCQSMQSENVYIAKASTPTINVAKVACGVDAGHWSCYPTGTMTNIPTATSWFDDPRSVEFYQTYYSPGLYCPSGWGPVATASRNATQTVEWNGAFDPATTSLASDVVFLENLVNNVFLQVLAPSETAVLCCPKSMTPGSAGEICYSTLPNYTFSTACYDILPPADRTVSTETKSIWWYGTTVEALFQSLTTYGTDTVTNILHSSDWSSLVAVTAIVPITLVHQPTDVSTSNPAVRITPRPPNWNGIKTVLGITAAGMFLGAAMILPW